MITRRAFLPLLAMPAIVRATSLDYVPRAPWRAVPNYDDLDAGDNYPEWDFIMAVWDIEGKNGLTIPAGYLHRGELPVMHFPELYKVIGNTYGGDGETFKLPDLRGRVVQC